MKLVKTLLTTKPTNRSFWVGILSLGVLLLLFGKDKTLIANGDLIYRDQEYWRAFTTSLLHADLNHLGHNALFFTGLAILLNNYFGWLVFPVLSFIMGGITNLIVLKFYPQHVYLVGISGVIYFMAGFWLINYVLIERQHTIARRLLTVGTVGLVLLFPEVFDHKTSYLAHGVGFLLGVPSGALVFFLTQKSIRAKEVWREIEPDPVFEELTSEENLPISGHVPTSWNELQRPD